jgi:hypothetical protein
MITSMKEVNKDHKKMEMDKRIIMIDSLSKIVAKEETFNRGNMLARK